MQITFTPNTHPKKPILIKIGPRAFRVTMEGFRKLETEMSKVTFDVIEWEMRQNGYPKGA